MADEPDGFESWGGDQGASERRSRPTVRLPRPSIRLASVIPTGRLMPALLTTLILAAGSVVGAELTRSGPFATTAVAAPTPSVATDAAGAVASGELPSGHWNWQLVATGTDQRTGEADVRAWDLWRACGTGAGCHLELARQVLTRSAPTGTTDRTALALASSSPDGSLYRANFAPVTTTCWYQSDGAWHSAAASQTDSFTLQWSVGTRSLIAVETSTTRGCPGGASIDSQRWSAARVPAAPTPALLASHAHAPSVAAFRAAAGRTCTAINSALEPYARRVVADRGVLNSAASSARAKARADDDIARALAPLVTLSVREYTKTPQPPRGRDDALWLRDIGLERSATADGAAMIAATQAAAGDAGRYFLTRRALDAQRAAAELFLAGNDAELLDGPGQASATLEQEQLRLPRSCLNSPAANAIFGVQASVAA